jgi:GntR family transcriptional regulator
MIAEMNPGERLESEQALARRLRVSRATLREAMRTYETQGLIRRRQGSGTYVLRPSHVIESGLEVLESIETLAQRFGMAVSAGEVHIERRQPTPEEAEALQVEPSARVLAVSRVTQAEGRSLAYLVDVLPEDILQPEELEDKFSGSVLDVLLRRGDADLLSSRCEITADTASAEVARSLGIQRGDVLLRFVAYLYTTTGRVVDYSYSYFLPGSFRFHVVRRVGQR